MNDTLNNTQLTDAFSYFGNDVRMVIAILLCREDLELEEIKLIRIRGAEFSGMFEIPSASIAGEYTAGVVIVRFGDGGEVEFHNPSIPREGRVGISLVPVEG